MSQLLISVVSFLIAISILVAFHEFGHFWVARRFGIKVIRFSIGFGKPFFRWHDKLGTEYVLSMLPFGGYVNLLGERDREIPKSERHMAFSHKSVGVRMLVLFAGPFANFIFAILAFWLMFMIGIASPSPIIGSVQKGSIAELAGLHPMERIVSVEHKPTNSWEGVALALISALGNERTITVETEETSKHSKLGAPGAIVTHTLDLSSLEKRGNEENLIKELGIVPLDAYPPVVKAVLDDYPAAKAGFQSGDHIVGINNHEVSTRGEVSEIIKSHSGKLLHLQILRDNRKIDLEITPVAKKSEEGKVEGFIGIEYDSAVSLPKDKQSLQQFGPFAAFKAANLRTAEYILFTLGVLKKMITGVISTKNLSGPISIAQYAGQSLSIGFVYFLSFLAVISISLGVLNLLPIPMLDGGQLLYCFYELIMGKPLPEEAQIYGLWLGGFILFSIMLLAIYNDIMRF